MNQTKSRTSDHSVTFNTFEKFLTCVRKEGATDAITVGRVKLAFNHSFLKTFHYIIQRSILNNR